MGVSISVLSNGLTVITEHVSHVETVVVGVWVDVGSRHEGVADQGISHFLEHMAFKGTGRRNARQISEEIENVGGRLNAATGNEITAYYASVLKEDLGLAVDILSDILTGSAFEQRELERERNVVIQEICSAHDTPDELVFDLFFEAAYADQPLGHPILGTVETVSGFTPDRLRAYLEANYRGSGMVLCAVGAVAHDELLRLAESCLGCFPDRHRAPLLQAAYRGGERRAEQALEQSQFVLGFPAPCSYDEGRYAARLLAIIMGGGMSSRLFQEIREARGLCYSISSFHWPYRDTGLFGIHAGTAPRDLPELVEATAGELRRAARDIGQEEMMRARRQVKAGLLMSMESLFIRAERLARQMILFREVKPIDEVQRRFEAVSLEQIQEVAMRFCLSETPAVAAVGPLAHLEPYEHIASQLKQD